MSCIVVLLKDPSYRLREGLTSEKFFIKLLGTIGLFFGIFFTGTSKSGESMADDIGINFIDDIVDKCPQNSTEYERRVL